MIKRIFILTGSWFLLAFFTVTVWGQSTYTIPLFSPPRHMDLCGEPVPLYNEDVWERFDREFTIVVYSHAQVYLWLKRASRYFPWLEKTLREKHLPEDLKYLVIAESDLLHNVRSPAGAVGPWQFIYSTAKRYGFRINRQIDERYDFEKATEKALDYLQDLYNRFQSWTLAMAAYNCGEDRIERELKQQRVSTYYDLKPPTETERYIFRILVIKEVLSHPEKYGYEYTPSDGYQPQSFEKVSVRIKYSLPLVDVAECAGITYRRFVMLNPSFRSDSIPPGGYEIRIPVGTTQNFLKKLQQLQKKYAKRMRYHVVKKGETLSSIARKYGLTINKLKVMNGLRSDRIFIGQRLRINQ